MRIKNFYGAKKIFFALGFIFLTFFSASLALAQSGNYVPLVPIPGVTGATGLLGYLSGLYNFLISVVGILAMAVIVYGGLRYLTSVGNPSAVESAKETIMSAIYGLILALVSWMILNTINPDTLLLKKPGVAGPSGTYGTATFANKCSASPTGAGTVASPCVCLDGAKVQNLNATKTQTTLTLAVNPTTIGNAVAVTVTMSGKLTDASGPLNAMTIKINRIAPLINASNTYTTTTNASGDYTATMTFAAGGPGTGVGGDIMQAVFAGDATYAAVGSNTVIFTRNSASGTYLPTDYLYNTMGGLLPVATIIINGYDCNATCSNALMASDTKFHCLAPRLGIGKTPEEAQAGGRSITDAKIGDYIFFDTITNTKTGFTIVKVEVDYDNSFWSWLFGSADYVKYINDNIDCGAVSNVFDAANDKYWSPDVGGYFAHKYSSTGTYNPILRVFIKENGCVGVEDKGALIKVN